MQQLSGADNVSLFAERRNVYNHVGTLVVYDVTTAPGGKVRFKDILRHFDERLPLHPVFRRRLATVPFGLDRPYWVTAADLDVEYHIRHIALPRPGDWRQLMIQVARLHSRPLDRAHPLWEAYVIEGLDNIPKLPSGAFAIFLKIHHAVVDGMAAIHLLRELHTATPAGDGPPDRTGRLIADRDPSGYELLARSLTNNLGRALRLARVSGNLAARALAAGKEQWPTVAEGNIAGLLARATELLPAAAPKTRFSGHVSRHRVMEGFGMPISRINRIRSKVPGVTLNDVFIAVAGGAARKYLLARNELPEYSLSGLMPISLRSDASGGGNEVAGVPVRVRSDIADPIDRLLAVHDEALASKARGEKMGLDLLKNLFDVLPPLAVSGLVERVILPQHQHDRVERARPRPGHVPRGRQGHVPLSGQHPSRRRRTQLHRRELQRRDVGLDGVVPKHGAGSRRDARVHARGMGGAAGRGRRPAGSRQAAAAAQRSPACAQALEIQALNRGWLPRLSRIGPSGPRPRAAECRVRAGARRPNPSPIAGRARHPRAAWRQDRSSARCTSQSVKGMAWRACVLPA